MAPKEPKRYLGLDLAGARNDKTTLATLEYYPREKKIFLLDVYDGVGPTDNASGDETLLELINELRTLGTCAMGVNVPLTMPPCLPCTRKTCPSAAKCTVPAVKWMRDTSRKAARRWVTSGSQAQPKAKDIVPYTQRPIELWVRYHVLPELDRRLHFDIDEAMGGTKAPLTARMAYLKRHLGKLPVVETWPKLSMALLGKPHSIPARYLTSYRHLEQGAHSRLEIMESLSERCGIFIYDRDMRKLAENLSAFDAFLCAYTALLSDTGLCAKIPKGFPKNSGWVHYPEC